MWHLGVLVELQILQRSFKVHFIKTFKTGRINTMIEEFSRSSFYMIFRWTADCCLCRYVRITGDKSLGLIVPLLLLPATSFSVQEIIKTLKNLPVKGILQVFCTCCCCPWCTEEFLNCTSKFPCSVCELCRWSCSHCCYRLLNRSCSLVFLVALRQIEDNCKYVNMSQIFSALHKVCLCIMEACGR